MAGLNGMKDIPAYTASKHGVVGLSKAVCLPRNTEAPRLLLTMFPGWIEIRAIRDQGQYAVPWVSVL